MFDVKCECLLQDFAKFCMRIIDAGIYGGIKHNENTFL